MSIFWKPHGFAAFPIIRIIWKLSIMILYRTIVYLSFAYLPPFPALLFKHKVLSESVQKKVLCHHNWKCFEVYHLQIWLWKQCFLQGSTSFIEQSAASQISLGNIILYLFLNFSNHQLDVLKSTIWNFFTVSNIFSCNIIIPEIGKKI